MHIGAWNDDSIGLLFWDLNTVGTKLYQKLNMKNIFFFFFFFQQNFFFFTFSSFKLCNAGKSLTSPTTRPTSWPKTT